MATESEKANYLAERVLALEEANRFFSPRGKEKREMWVAERFLSHVAPHLASEVTWVDAEPWDVLCVGARIQIKEHQDAGRRRHDEFKQALARAKNAIAPAELGESWTPSTVSLATAVEHVIAAAEMYSTKYAPAVLAELDLLIYLNIEASIEGSELKPLASLSSGWRSVSAVCNDCAFVLVATRRAPSFIRAALGNVFRARA
jgi:hypothetical protein